MDNGQTDKLKRKQKPIERAVVYDDNIKVLHKFKEQIQTTLGEYIKINYTDLVNLLIESHADALMDAEIELVKTKKYDQVKHLKWVLRKAQEAKKVGEHIKLSEVLNTSFDGIATSPSPKHRKPKKSKAIESSVSGTLPNADLNSLESTSKI